MDSAYWITNYQTSFVIDDKPAKEVFSTIVAQIWGWLAEKERKYRTKDGKSKRYAANEKALSIFRSDRIVARGKTGFGLFKSGQFSSRIGLKDSLLRTLMCVLNDRILWGMEYTERQRDMEWVTEIGITSFKDSPNDKEKQTEGNNEITQKHKGIVFYIRVSYSPKRAFCKAPDPSVPRLIYMLLDPEEANTFSAHGSGFKFNFGCKKLQKVSSESNSGVMFVDFLFSTVRRFPVLVLAADEQCLTSEVITTLANLNRRLLGKTLIFVLDPQSPAYAETRKRLRLDVNTLYLIRPREERFSRPTLEDYGIRHGKLFALQKALEAHIYRQRPVLEVDAVTPRDVAMMRQQEYDRKLQEAREQGRLDEIEKLKREKKEDEEVYFGLMEDEGAHRRLAEQKAKSLEEENKSLKQQLVGLIRREAGGTQETEERKLNSLASTLGSMIGKRTLREQVEVCKQFFADRLVFTNKALKSLESSPREFGFKEVMLFLVPLYTRLYPSYVSSTIGCRRENLLEDLSIEYTANENTLTMDTEKFRRDRTVTYNGSEYVCEEHLKMTRGDARLYFAYSEKEKKIIICHIGKHLDTAGTKKRGH